MDETSALSQITEGHQTMMKILESRKIKLDVVLTFWKKEDVTQLVSYMLRMDDDSLYADVLPCLAHSIREQNSIGKKVTLGICFELLPVLQKLLKSKYEDYIVKSLDFVRIMSHNWFMELRDMKKNGAQGDASNRGQSVSLPPIYLSLVNMQERIKKLCRRSGQIGDKAKVIDKILEELT